MRKNIFLILLVAAIFIFGGTMHQSAKAADDPVEFIKNAKTPVHFHSLAGGDSLVHNLPDTMHTWWESIYPLNTFGAVWYVQRGISNGIPGLNPSDKLRIGYYTSYPPGQPRDSLWIHVEDVTITLKLKRLTSPFDLRYVEYSGGVASDSVQRARFNPVCTFWHEVWPNYCQWWGIDSWKDNGSSKVDSCDTIGIVKAENIKWRHVVRVDSLATGFFLKLENLANPSDTMKIKFSGGANPDSILRARQTPVCTWWHEEWPAVPPDTGWWHIKSWHDNGNNYLDSCDTLDIVRARDIEWWHVIDIATDIEVLSIPDPTVPTMTQWGLIILVVLLIVSAVFVALKRRKAAVPA